ASPMPVLPDVESRIVLPATSAPDAMPSSIIFFAGRSLTEPPGLKPSSFASMRTPSASPSRTRRISTIGVFPMRSSTECTAGGPPAGASGDRVRCAAFRIRLLATAGDRGNDGHLVAGLHGRVEVLEEADVFAVHEDVDEAAHRAGFVADPLP